MDPYERWIETWSQVGAAPPDGLIQQLVAAYGESHRAYHTVRHLAECFGHLDPCPVRPSDPAALELALWFHDAIYDTKAANNEERSAAWARTALASLSQASLDRIEKLILVTKHEAAPSSPDEELLLDVDLSILGSADERFDEYESQIRQEYSWVPEEAYRMARAQILAQFQSRPALYQTPYFRDTLETQARRNLRRSLDSLAA